MTINERIKELRHELGLSQAKFAAKISISNGYIAAIELGKRDVNERMMKLICNQFHVNPVWLKTGEGEMLAKQVDTKVEQAMEIFKKLNPEFQDYIMKQIDQLIEIQNKQNEGDESK